MPETEPDTTAPLERRDFFKKTLALVLGGVSMIFPAAAGLVVFLDPLRRKTADRGLIRVASLEALPADGAPRKFSVVADRSDAWNRFPDVPIGAVYLRRTGENAVQAFNVVCPHAGCFVDYLRDRGHYLCPCHNSTFDREGRIQAKSSPASRGLDSLEVEIRDNTEIWVRFQNFRAGTAEKIPRA